MMSKPLAYALFSTPTLYRDGDVSLGPKRQGADPPRMVPGCWIIRYCKLRCKFIQRPAVQDRQTP